jgi:hypothetical protein
MNGTIGYNELAANAFATVRAALTAPLTATGQRMTYPVGDRLGQAGGPSGPEPLTASPSWQRYSRSSTQDSSMKRTATRLD